MYHAGEPARHVGAGRDVLAFNNGFTRFDIDHLNTVEVTAIENGVHHQLGHDRVVDMCGQR